MTTLCKTTLGKTLFAGLLLTALNGPRAHAQHWPSFRGPEARGVADGQDLPESWDVETRQNVSWITPIPGMAHSSPIVWSGRVFVTTAVARDAAELVLGDEGGIAMADDDGPQSWRMLCLDLETGHVQWSRTAFSGKPRARRHLKASHANETPATDGAVVVALFGSQGLAAFELDGTIRWSLDLGVLDPGMHDERSSSWGHASSPVVHDGLAFVQLERHGASELVAVRLADGQEAWRVELGEKSVWATPTLHVGPERAELIAVGGERDRGLDPRTGEELWRFERDYQVKTPTPFVAGERIVLAGGYRGKPVFTLPLGARGAIGEPSWESAPGGPYTSTPVAYGQHLFFVRDTGILAVLSLETGERLYRERIEGTFSASPVASDGRIYLTSEEGVVTVVTASATPEVLARNDMGEPCMATPAISAHKLLVRSRSHLVAIGSSDDR